MRKNQLIVRGGSAPTLEIDPAARAVYIRFSHAKISRTVTDPDARPGAIVTTDVDSRNQIIGVEIVGIREFSIKAIRRKLPDRLQGIDFERARFMPAVSCQHDPVPA